MGFRFRIALIALCLAAASLYLHSLHIGHPGVWTRDHPLTNPIAVRNVANGTLTLADGRTFRPTGITRRDEVTPENFDIALRLAVAQGVVIIRDLGDGSAFLQCEPKFNNPCGTTSCGSYHHGLGPRIHWNGGYFPCPLSEFLAMKGFATPDPLAPGLSARERWRLEGVTQVGGISWVPRINAANTAFRYDGEDDIFEDGDAMGELMSETTPPP